MTRWAALLLFLAVPAVAVEPAMNAQAVIEDTALDGQGLVNVNVGAGDLHQQINGRAIAVGVEHVAHLRLRQELELLGMDLNQDAQASILGASFSSSSGVTGVNQAAGTGNQQINAFRLSLGRQQRQDLDDSVLAQQLVAPAQPSGATDQPRGGRIVVTDDKAFAGSRGVVQLNQSAGVGNQSVNNLSMTVVD